ncbi:hypothetical protein B9Z55_020598 [Caenorhabditis nigoni]|uniref:SXP/RAL-2 family protein Ani s 5-like cation-binding domain-containing protein n=1 Tax=Caenorhabditis nigoni TaxID=1611254 RepID=A0A2G5TNH2_9PELO|nr:hypothetical protein B9Z55_020598 [Caenorhabditis nigoni]
MFSLFNFLLCSLVISAFAAPTTEEEVHAELKAAGMTQASIDGLAALRQRFATGYPLVQSNTEAADKFIAEFRSDTEKYIKSMPENDQTVYNNYLKKYGIA